MRPPNPANAPLCHRDLRDFPRASLEITPSVEAACAASLSRTSSSARSFCLRVSGAVAPSAPCLGAGSLPRGIECMAAGARLTTGGGVALHHRGGVGRVNATADASELLFTLFRPERRFRRGYMRSGTSIPRMPRTFLSAKSVRSQRPRRAALRGSSSSERMWCSE